MTIYFYKAENAYGCFSNFSPHAISLPREFVPSADFSRPAEIRAEIGDTARVLWPTVEHFYQAQKFLGSADADLIDRIRAAPSPEAAAALGRHPAHRLRPDWEAQKCLIMTAAVWAKFATHAEIRAVLLATGQEDLVEDSPRDSYWGCGADRQGHNHLGKILMAVRSRLAASTQKSGRA